jgi:uncharacterized protein DUF6932
MSQMAKPPLLPAFSPEGLLPIGDYSLTIAELRKSALVVGPRGKHRSRHWDAEWRASLVDNLEVLAGELEQVGINEIFVNGSFVEAKDYPNDIDGYFVCETQRFVSGQLERDLKRVSAKRCWTWESKSRRPVSGHGWKLPMWIEYRIELFPHFGQGTGICDRFGNELQFPAAFRLSRSGHPKGIVKLVRGK